MRHISDSERLTIAALNRRETELKAAKDTIRQYQREIEAMNVQIASLRDANQMLCGQIRYLTSKFSKQDA